MHFPTDQVKPGRQNKDEIFKLVSEKIMNPTKVTININASNAADSLIKTITYEVLCPGHKMHAFLAFFTLLQGDHGIFYNFSKFPWIFFSVFR